MVRASAPRFTFVLARFRFAAVLLVALVAWLLPGGARAEGHEMHGVAVVSMGEVDAVAAYALAQGVYHSTALKPAVIDEPRARALLGQKPQVDTAESTRFAELRDGVRDEGAVSRSVLASIASGSQAEAVALIRPSETPGHVQIRLYLASNNAFDVSLYDGDANDPAWRNEVVHALERRFDPNAAAATPVAAHKPSKKAEKSDSRSLPFYKSPWFWGAIGGAVVLGGTALLVSHVTSSEDVKIRVEPPTNTASSALGFFRFGSVAP